MTRLKLVAASNTITISSNNLTIHSWSEPLAFQIFLLLQDHFSPNPSVAEQQKDAAESKPKMGGMEP